jgi:hypothetical protein
MIFKQHVTLYAADATTPFAQMHFISLTGRQDHAS